jgi:tetratricopeptide (TPR) repeat protein
MHFGWYSGDVDQAIADYTAAINEGRKLGFAHANRAVAWHAKGKYAEAKADYMKAIEIQPEEPGCHQEYAWLLATCPDEQFHDGKLAVEHAILFFELATAPVFRQPGNYRQHGDRAIRVAVANDEIGGGMGSLFFKGWNWESLETLAAAFAESGQFERAVKWQEHAIDVFHDKDGQPIGHLSEVEAKEMNERLDLYKRGEPYRQARHRAAR